ncbi:MAG: hypothetical protein HY898_23680 [Deltaproteobacteria bacterium]|nr:hypothetical protein [Deltaproteobacteria bacterium]
MPIASAAPSASAPAASKLRLHPFAKLSAGNSNLLPAHGYVLFAYNDLLFRATPEGLHQDLALMKGFHRDWSELDAFGVWPAFAFAEVNVKDRRYLPPGEEPALIRWSEGRGWFHTRLQVYSDRITAVAPWSEGRSLGAANINPTVESLYPTQSDWDPHWRLFQTGDTLSAACPDGLCKCKTWDRWGYLETGKCTTPAPSPQCAPSPDSRPTDGRCMARLELFANRAAFSSLTSGHVFALGVDTTLKSRPVSVERWEPGKVDSILEHLDVPGHRPADVDYRMLVVSGTEVYVHKLTKPYIALFDGTGWKPSPLPKEGTTISRLIASESGTVWAIAQGRLYEKTRGQTWRPMNDVVASPAHLDEIAWSEPDNLWAIDRTAHLLLGPPAGKQVMELPSADLVAKSRQEDMMPVTPACTSIYVSIHAPITEFQTFPEVRAAIQGEPAIKGLQLTLAKRVGRLELGATVSDYTVATRFIEVLRSSSPSFKPTLWCHEPRIAKVLLSTS